MVDINQIHNWANEAVEMAKHTGLVLDCTRGSIGALERTLDSLRQKDRDDSATWDLACRFGAYLGEVMLKDFKEFGYSWDEDYDGEPCLITTKPQNGASLNKILPITKCNKYLLSGQSESVATLYATCISMLKGGDMAENLTSLGIDASQSSGIEPTYLLNGRFNANAAAWLLYGDYVFFQQNEIIWDGTAHAMRGMQVNAAKVNEIPTLVSNISVLQGMLEFLTELEKDEGLRVPLYMIHPGVRDAIRNEDLTGITLFNLMAQAQALIVKEPEPDHYAVMCDSRLPMGIPAFYQLVARMIWDMRAYNERTGAFEVVFANARNFDADVVLGEVDRMVPGAVSNAVWKVQVSELPQVELPSAEEAEAFAREASRVFASGFDDPMDIQADEQLFETALNQLAKEFPIIQDIEGTGYMDRIAHIEHVQAGDPLVLAADWENQWFDPVCIEVFNAKGETLGNLSNRFSITLSGHRELACLLPHITATVETVTPKSKRRKNAKYALMDVRMELDPAVLGRDGNLIPEVMEEAKALLELPRGERVLLSKGDLVASQLKGNIDVSEAHDAADSHGGAFPAKGNGAMRADAPEKPSSTLEPTLKQEETREKRTIRESHFTSALSRIEKMLNEKVTPSFFIETSEMAAHALMADRQSACDSAISAWNDDLDNFIAIARESNSFNRIMCRYYGYFVDALQAQASFGCTPGEIQRMSNEVSEFSELVAEGFSCGNSYYDSIVNSRAPVTRPAEYAAIRRRWLAVKSEANRKLEVIAREEARKRAEAEAEARRKAAEEEQIRKQIADEFLQIPLLLKRIGDLAGKDGYCAATRICEGFEDIVTVSQVEKALDSVWHQGIVRKATTSEGALYAIAWSDDAWRKARDKENARLAEEHRLMDEANAKDFIRKNSERISGCESIEESLQKYIAKLRDDESAAMARLLEGKASLATLGDAVAAKSEEVKALEVELSNQGFFAFGKKRELRNAIAQAKASADKLMQEQMKAEERVVSLQEELDSIKRNLSKQNDQLIETRNTLAELKQSLDSGPGPLPVDIKGHIYSMMKLFACPVSALWCVENVAGVEDEGTALSALEGMARARAVTKYSNDTYALADPRAFKNNGGHDVGASQRDGSHRLVSEARLANERLAKKVYDCMPNNARGVTTRDVVGLVHEITTTQKAAAVMRVGVELGYFTKTVEENGVGAIAHFFKVPGK